MKLSVIVPAYNVADSLEKCLESIVTQDIEDMEVIVVDDGSTDASPDIANRFASQYPFLSVIHQKNAGLSAARNAGMAKSTGDFITFVDGDDYLMERIYSCQSVLLNLYPDVDVLEFSVQMERETDHHHHLYLGDVGYDNALEYWVTSRGFRHCYACNKIFRRSILEKEDGSLIQFPLGRHFEDVFFMAELFRKNPKIVSSSQVGYFYTDNPGGISAQVNEKNLYDLCDAHMAAAEALGLVFRNPLDHSQARYYLDVLNRQLSARLLAGRPIDLHHCRVPMEKAEGLSMKVKAFIQNWFGIHVLVALMWVGYALTFKKFRTIK